MVHRGYQYWAEQLACSLWSPVVVSPKGLRHYVGVRYVKKEQAIESAIEEIDRLCGDISPSTRSYFASHGFKEGN